MRRTGQRSKAVSEEDEVRYQTLQKTLHEFMDGYVEMGISEERFAFGFVKASRRTQTVPSSL